MSSAITLVFCVDRNALPGLHTTLSTTLQNLSWREKSVNVYVLSDSLTDSDLALLEVTVRHSRLEGEVRIEKINCDASQFSHFRNHVGCGWMTYARILAAELVECETFLYMDADLLVFADVAELFDLDMSQQCLGAASWGTVAESNDRNFFSRNYINPTTPYFNAGVLLINPLNWKAEGMTAKCKEFGEKHLSNLPSADQTILNAVFAGSFLQIPRRFNTPATASRSRLTVENIERRVVHLVSRPKPWDALGWLNGQCNYWEQALRNTAISNFQRPWPAIQNVRQSKSYLKCWRNALNKLR